MIYVYSRDYIDMNILLYIKLINRYEHYCEL